MATKRRVLIVLGVFGLCCFAFSEMAKADYETQIVEPSPDRQYTTISVTMSPLINNDAYFYMGHSWLFLNINGQYEYIDVDPTQPVWFIVRDGHPDAANGSDIFLDGVGYQPGFSYDIFAWGGNDQIEVRIPANRNPIFIPRYSQEVYASIYAGNGDDVVIGGPSGEYIQGDGLGEVAAAMGDDILIGGGGDDVIEADLGNDFLFGSAGFDILNGGPGMDTLMGNESVGHNGTEPLSTVDGVADDLIGGPGRDNFIYDYFWWKGSLFKSKVAADVDDNRVDYNPSEDLLTSAEVPVYYSKPKFK